MKAIQLIEAGKPLLDVDLPTPQPQPGEVLVKVHAAGICHSDVHYRNGRSPAGPLPLIPGHEVAGVIEASETPGWEVGDRVCLHYLTFCGSCSACMSGHEQFCPESEMIGKSRNGGFAEYIAHPTKSIYTIPADVGFAEAAIMMCSTATSYHALNKARLQPGETVAIFGCGGLGFSALQLAKVMGASRVFAVDIDEHKLKQAERLGAEIIHAGECDPVAHILSLTNGSGVDVAIELIGLPQTMAQCVHVLGNRGRAALAGITDQVIDVDTYRDLIGREGEMIGVSDHLGSEIEQLLAWRSDGKIKPGQAVTRKVPLEAGAVNEVLDRLEAFGSDTRTVIDMSG
jgi:D-arabinose 1-dehydrogenase-like Zn-dependent alcohol dehydrogenase